jgi:hypothetical protein
VQEKGRDRRALPQQASPERGEVSRINITHNTGTNERTYQRRQKANDQIQYVDTEGVGDNVPALREVSALEKDVTDR